MTNDGQRTADRSGRASTGLIPHSFKTLSRIVSSGASSVASTVRSAASAASAMMERDGETNYDQVSWAGFDELEPEKGMPRQVLLLGFSHGFQVWDVEEADNVCNLASRHDTAVSFMQMQPVPLTSCKFEDKFAPRRPLLVMCGNGSVSEDNGIQEEAGVYYNGRIQHCNGPINGTDTANTVWFYSLKSQCYVHFLKFRSVVHLVQCSCRVVCVLQSAQIHCLNSATLEREYTILTNPATPGCYGYRSGNIGIGPLAVGPRWMAYSGSLVVATNSGRVSPQHLSPSCSFPAATSNGNLVAHYAKETRKQLVAGIVTLGDMGCKKLSRYYSDLLPDGKNGLSGTAVAKINGAHASDPDNVGMVIVRDIVRKTVIAQFRAHDSPIAALCFDPSGMLLVTASVRGHNINVFRIGQAGGSTAPPYAHLYSLQRGITNAVIQDISFSSDSQWIMISSSRGTSHLFAISPSGGMVSFQCVDAGLDQGVSGTCSMTKSAARMPLGSGLQMLTPRSISESGSPITLSAVSRIRSGSNGWRNMVSSAAAATGQSTSLCGAIASAFHKCKGNDLRCEVNSLKKNYYLLVFSPSGCMLQYALHFSSVFDGLRTAPGMSLAGDQSLNCDARLIVEAIQKWNICLKPNRSDMNNYGESGTSDSNKVYPENMKFGNGLLFDSNGSATKERTTEENYNMYISEAELQMHQNTSPLWLRSEIYFQSLLPDSFDGDERASCCGEIEIEKLPIRSLEARSKELIPVYNSLHSPRIKLGRVSVRNCKPTEQFQANRLYISGNSNLSHESRSGSLEDGLEEDDLDALDFINGGFVNMAKDTPVVELQLEPVNTRENSTTHSQTGSVHNRDGPDDGNHQLGEDEEFD